MGTYVRTERLVQPAVIHDGFWPVYFIQGGLVYAET